MPTAPLPVRLLAAALGFGAAFGFALPYRLSATNGVRRPPFPLIFVPMPAAFCATIAAARWNVESQVAFGNFPPAQKEGKSRKKRQSFVFFRVLRPDPSTLLLVMLRRRISDRHVGPPRGPVPGKEGDVKLIIAAIKPYKLEEVREALTAVGVRGMMVSEIKGFGSQSGHTEIYRGAEYAVNFVPKMKLEIAVADAIADEVVETIAKTARTDKIGDGKIFVLDLQAVQRVRTGESGEDAL